MRAQELTTTQAISRLVRAIRFRRRVASCYRLLNILFFGTFKVCVPLGSLAVAANLVFVSEGKGFMSPLTAIIISAAVSFMAGLDSILNPAKKKRVAFKTQNALLELETRVIVQASRLPQDDLSEYVLQVNRELRTLLDNYADEGY